MEIYNNLETKASKEFNLTFDSYYEIESDSILLNLWSVDYAFYNYFTTKIIQSNNDYQMIALYESTYILEDLGDDINYFDEIFDMNFLPKEEGEKINKILANIKKKMK